MIKEVLAWSVRALFLWVWCCGVLRSVPQNSEAWFENIGGDMVLAIISGKYWGMVTVVWVLLEDLVR